MEEQRLEKIDEKINQLKAQKESILARKKEKERKARTRKLIQVGALFEKYSNLENLEDIEKWLQEHFK